MLPRPPIVPALASARSIMLPVSFAVCGLLLLIFFAGLTGCGAPFTSELPGEEVSPSDPNAFTCSCDCETTATPTVAPQNFIAAGPDDAARTQNLGQTVLTANALDLGQTGNGSLNVVGLRFQTIGIPPGSEIVSASIQFTAAQASPSGNMADLFIDVVLMANADQFTASTDLKTLTLTNAPVEWNPGPWTGINETGPAQTTPNLASLLQSIVGLQGYTHNSAIAFIVYGAGRRTAKSFESSTIIGNVHTQAPRLTVEYKPGTTTQKLLVCGPPAQAEVVCAGNVTSAVSGLAAACKLAVECKCTFEAGPDATFSKSCNDPCPEVLPPSDCNPEDFAKSTGPTSSINPVCLGHSPLGSALFGRRSACDVDESQSTVTVQLVDDDGDSISRTPHARGSVEFLGTPCPGGTCDVGMTYRLHINDITIENFFGDNTFSQLSGVGESLPTGKATLDASGAGAFGFGATLNSARGHHNEGDQTTALLAPNADPISVGLGGWQAGGVCTLQGNLVGTANPRHVCSEGPTPGKTCTSPADCGTCGDHPCACTPLSNSVTMTANVRGVLVNQPPTAVAGPDQTVECNDTGRALFSLDASDTDDPDNNVAFFGWFRGSRTGDLVGTVPKIVLEQAVNDTIPYFFKVIDKSGQHDEATTEISVVDTTPPTIASVVVSRTRLWPPDHRLVPVSVSVSVFDICDAAPTCRIISVSSNEPIDGLGDGDTAPDWVITGDLTVDLRAERSGTGTGRVYTITVQCTDSSGNSATKAVPVRVPKSQGAA